MAHNLNALHREPNYMSTLKKGLLILLLPLCAFTAHKFYVSVTHVNYSEKDRALQITSRVFIDDFEAVLEERYDVTAKLATETESEMADGYIEKYVREKFVVRINGKERPFTFLGKEYDADVMICYFEIPDVDLSKLKSLEVQSELLTDLFEEQQNVIHLKIKGKKKSFVLVRENNKGMLNL